MIKYNLVQTKKGFFPVQEITEGTEVMCHGLWRKASRPVFGMLTTCYFDSLPACSFETDFVNSDCVAVAHNQIYNDFMESLPQQTVDGYLHRHHEYYHDNFHFSKLNELNYWYPLFVKWSNHIGEISIEKNGFRLKFKYKEEHELSGNELAERNLEYYLEGMLRKNFRPEKDYILTSNKLCETDKLVLRLLDICVDTSNWNTKIRYPTQILKHIKDDYTKNKITDEMLALYMKKAKCSEGYTLEYKIKEKKQEEGWYIPFTNPDINSVTPYSVGSFLTYRERK